MKAKTVPAERRGEQGIGDVWTWVALDPDTKLVPSWVVGERGEAEAMALISDLAPRLRNRVQITTDGHRPYIDAIERVFGRNVDYAMLVKEYGSDPTEERRFSPPIVLSERVYIVQGAPASDLISTSYVERQNLTMRMSMRRFTRLTNAFSKKIENHAARVSLHFLHYNFGRVHSALGKVRTPAIAAGLADHVWTCEEIAALIG
jgi:IS1 family transposase